MGGGFGGLIGLAITIAVLKEGTKGIKKGYKNIKIKKFF